MFLRPWALACIMPWVRSGSHFGRDSKADDLQRSLPRPWPRKSRGCVPCLLLTRRRATSSCHSENRASCARRSALARKKLPAACRAVWIRRWQRRFLKEADVMLSHHDEVMDYDDVGGDTKRMAPVATLEAFMDARSVCANSTFALHA